MTHNPLVRMIRENWRISYPETWKCTNDFKENRYFEAWCRTSCSDYPKNPQHLIHPYISKILTKVNVSFSVTSMLPIFMKKKRKDGTIQLWILTFLHLKSDPRKEDLANIYIDIHLNNDIMNDFLKLYWQRINYVKLCEFAFLEMGLRIKNGTELTIKEKKEHYKSMIILKRLQESDKITAQ